MWGIFESRAAEKNIDRLPKHILEKYEFWKNVVHISGPEGLRTFKGFKDHALKGEWGGHRSSYLNDTYRVIYRIDGQEVKVYVIDVNAHDYRRR
jgi:addiction module RelE/StbE family toxin